MTDISGFDELADEMNEFAAQAREAASRIEPAMDDGVESTARILNKEMKKNVYRLDAVDTGELVNSIEFTQVDTATYTVGPTADHAVYIEYGTGEFGGGDPITPNSAQALAFETQGGEQVVVASAEGMRPRPFFRNAVDRIEEEELLPRNVVNEVKEMFEEVFS